VEEQAGWRFVVLAHEPADEFPSMQEAPSGYFFFFLAAFFFPFFFVFLGAAAFFAVFFFLAFGPMPTQPSTVSTTFLIVLFFFAMFTP